MKGEARRRGRRRRAADLPLGRHSTIDGTRPFVYAAVVINAGRTRPGRMDLCRAAHPPFSMAGAPGEHDPGAPCAVSTSVVTVSVPTVSALRPDDRVRKRHADLGQIWAILQPVVVLAVWTMVSGCACMPRAAPAMGEAPGRSRPAGPRSGDDTWTCCRQVQWKAR